jgi:DNA-binding MarR family transcriptional regulator
VIVADLAAQIDRLVIAGHSNAGRQEKPPVLASLNAQPGLLNTVAVVLLRRSIGVDDVGRILGYTPPSLVAMLVDDNVEHGFLDRSGDQLALTADGRAVAEAVVDVQERAVDDLWSGAGDVVAAVADLAGRAVTAAISAPPPVSAPVYPLFAGVLPRPTEAANALRAITALRYWRADAHRAVLAEAGLSPRAAHALNVLWDRHREVTRVGQGSGEPGTKGLADVEAAGLAAGGVISDTGIAQREAIERATDDATEPVYAGLDEQERSTLLAALSVLAG